MAAWWIATGFFLFRPRRVAASLELYKALFPERGRWYHLLCTWRQFHEFAASYAEGTALDYVGKIEHVSEGWDYLQEATAQGRGGIIVTSHLGNWDIGARMFSQRGLKMMLLMGEAQAKELDRRQKDGLSREGLDVNVAPADSGSPFGGLEALSLLKQGGFVSIAGDIAWTGQRQRAPVKFLGRTVQLPLAPHLLALVSGAPILTLFAFRVAPWKHSFTILPPRTVKAAGRADRQAAVLESAQQYASDLENALRSHPWQWAVFEPFFTPSEE